MPPLPTLFNAIEFGTELAGTLTTKDVAFTGTVTDELGTEFTGKPAPGALIPAVGGTFTVALLGGELFKIAGDSPAC